MSTTGYRWPSRVHYRRILDTLTTLREPCRRMLICSRYNYSDIPSCVRLGPYLTNSMMPSRHSWPRAEYMAFRGRVRRVPTGNPPRFDSKRARLGWLARATVDQCWLSYHQLVNYKSAWFSTPTEQTVLSLKAVFASSTSSTLALDLGFAWWNIRDFVHRNLLPECPVFISMCAAHRLPLS